MSGKIDWDGFQQSFFDFLPRPLIQTKDEGLVHLKLYDAQRYFFDEVFDGLRHDVHDFVCGKGRQLGITTGCQLFDVFYAGAVPQIQGVIVFDTDGNKEKFRTLISGVISSLPETHALPITKGGNNRRGLVFENGNMIDYLVAGTKRGSGNLGRSRAYNYGHMSECAYYGDEDAVEAFINTLSQIYEYRCYFWESTGNGYNLFKDMWDDAVVDSISKRAIFVTWWRKRTYSYAKGTPLFKRYGWPQLSKDEQEATAEVQRDYGHKIGLEQWAWYRHSSDPRRQEGEDADIGDRQQVVHQEHPHTPEMMFRQTGSPFIPGHYIGPAMRRAENIKFKGYRYYLGDDISTMRLEQTKLVPQAHLRIWQEPSPIGVYIVGADTSYGISDKGDAMCAQIVRCYADKMVQVAEFCDRSVQPFQFAWILLHLCGWYGNSRYVLELNGSGEAVWTELKNLKRRVEDGSLAPPRVFATDQEEESDSVGRNTYSRVRQYLFRRSDSLGGGGYNYHMRTSLESKFTFMSQMADRFMLNELEINSVPCLKEIESLRKDGRSIEGEGKAKDDRPITLGLCTRAYIDDERQSLVSRNMTFEIEQLKAQEGGENLTARYMTAIMDRQFALKGADRRAAKRRASGRGWGW